MATKLIGNVVWVIQPEYPTLSSQRTSQTLAVKLHASAAGLAANLPALGAAWSSTDPFFGAVTNLVLTTREVKPLAGTVLYEVTLTYTDDDSSEYVSGSGFTAVTRSVERDTQDTDVPIGQHPNYRTCWNHVLLHRIADDSSYDITWWPTATDTVIPAANRENFRWAKPDDALPDGWSVLNSAVKKDVESFRDGVTTVHVIESSASKNALTKSAAADYTTQTPPDTFSLPSSITVDEESVPCWLRGGSKIKKNGRKWELEVSYLHAKRGVDTDIYQEA